MARALTVSEARPQLARLIDRAAAGKPVLLRRGDRVVRLAALSAAGSAKTKRAQARPFGYFKFDDDLTSLADRAAPAFTPLDEN